MNDSRLTAWFEEQMRQIDEFRSSDKYLWNELFEELNRPTRPFKPRPRRLTILEKAALRVSTEELRRRAITRFNRAVGHMQDDKLYG